MGGVIKKRSGKIDDGFKKETRRKSGTGVGWGYSGGRVRREGKKKIIADEAIGTTDR